MLVCLLGSLGVVCVDELGQVHAKHEQFERKGPQHVKRCAPTEQAAIPRFREL